MLMIFVSKTAQTFCTQAKVLSALWNFTAVTMRDAYVHLVRGKNFKWRTCTFIGSFVSA